MFPTNPEHEAIISGIARLLAELPVGGILSYTVANTAAGGRDVAGRYRYLLEKAREMAEAELGCIFECVRTVGIKRLPPDDYANAGFASIRKLRRGAKRGGKRFARVNPNSLSSEHQSQIIGIRAMHGAIAMIADVRRTQALGAVADPAKPIPPKNILAMFRATD